MKKFIIYALAIVAALSSCSKNSENDAARQQALLDEASRDELAQAVADRDQLLSLVNEISGDMTRIRQLENILSANTSGETPDERDRLRADIAAIQNTLQERRQRLEDLEQRLNSSNLNNRNLQQTVAALRTQIETQTEEIGVLRDNLDEARARIGELDIAVDSLNRTVDEVTADLDSTATRAIELSNDLNTCYYAIGTRNELRENDIIETGFLRRTKIMEGNFNQDFFNRADKRTLTSLDLNATRAEVLTNQPADSYRIDDINGHKVLTITDVTKFWSLSNYLVVQIN